MKIALIMNDNSYCGREYLDHIARNNITVDVLNIGNLPEINNVEQERCGDHWKPISTEYLRRSFNFYSFKSLKNPELVKFLKHQAYNLGIQGGTGILTPQIINEFKLGILNFHPGDLPQYRGCSAPEWQLYEGSPIICTCHLVDKGIDTGKIIQKRKLSTNLNSYQAFRASIYPEMAKFLVEILKEIVANNGYINPPKTQDEAKAQYRKYIGEDIINQLKSSFSTYSTHQKQ